MTKKYAVEDAAENLLKSISRLISAFRKNFFTIPKNMKDRNFQLMNTALWMFFVLSLIYTMKI